MTEEYKSMRKRIEKADGDICKLNKLEKSLVRLWDAGVFEQMEFKRLDLMIFDRQRAIEDFK